MSQSSTWRLRMTNQFDLENARTSLDEQGLKIAENQEASSKNRRKLAESTRDFKKAGKEEQSKLFGALLKAYQEEVDNLTKRAKFAEASFLGVYQKLYEAPDPVPSLASAAEVAANAAELAAENRRMHAELEEFRSESAHLKNQQATVRRLEERNRQLEQQMEEKVKEMVAMKQHVLAEESQRSMETLKSREDALQEQLRAARETVSNMQRLHEMSQSQLFELKAQSEEDRASKQGEVNLLTDEVERAQARLLALEREKEALKAQLQTAQPSEAADGESTDSSGAVGWEAAVRAKEAVIASLHQELHALEAAGAAEREEQRAEVKRLKALLQDQESSIGALRAELATRPTQRQWEDLRKQVKILQAVGYNAVEVDDWDEPGMASNGPGSSSDLSAAADGDSGKRGGEGGVMRSSSGADIGKLEALLLEKNKRMEHELTQVKMRLSEREEECDETKAKLVALEGTVAEQRALIGKLEDDILKGYGARDKHRAASVGSIVSMPGAAGGSGGGGVDGGVTGGSSRLVDDDSVLMVVCGQRDRFRQRMGELEEELRAERERSSKLATEVERLKADNVKLYERMRYVQDYTSAGGGGDRPNSSRSRKSDLEAGPAADVEGKYKKIYEETINPFAAFSTKAVSVGVGVSWVPLQCSTVSLIISYARTFVFFYSIGLHILVALSMYRLSSLSHARSKGVVYVRFKAQSEAVSAKKQLHGIRMGRNNISAHYFPPHSADCTEPHSTPVIPSSAAAPSTAHKHGAHREASPPPPPPLQQRPFTDPSLRRLLHALMAFSEQEQLVSQRREGEGATAAAAAAAGQEQLIVRENTIDREKGMTGAEEAVGQQQGLGSRGKERVEERRDEAALPIGEVHAERGSHLAAGGGEGESCVEEGSYYPFPPPHFRYAYPPPSAPTIINIALALIATPRLYTQRPPSLAPLPFHPSYFRHSTPFPSTPFPPSPFVPALSPFPPPPTHRPLPSPSPAPSPSHAPLPHTVSPAAAFAASPASSSQPTTSSFDSPSQPLRAQSPLPTAAAPPPRSIPSNPSPGTFLSTVSAAASSSQPSTSPFEAPSQPLRAQSPLPPAHSVTTPSDASLLTPKSTARIAAADVNASRLPPSASRPVTSLLETPSQPLSSAQSSIPAAAATRLKKGFETSQNPSSVNDSRLPLSTSRPVTSLLETPSQPLGAQSSIPAAAATPSNATLEIPRSTASRPKPPGLFPAQTDSSVGGGRDGGRGAVLPIAERREGGGVIRTRKRGEVEEEEEEEEEGGDEGVWEEGEEKRLERAGVRKVVAGNGGRVAGRAGLVVKKRTPVLQIQLRPEKKKPRTHEGRAAESNAAVTDQDFGVSLTDQEVMVTLTGRGAMTTGGQKESGAVAEAILESDGVEEGQRQDGAGFEEGRGKYTDGHKEIRIYDEGGTKAKAEEGDVGKRERTNVGEKGGDRETCSLADGVDKEREVRREEDLREEGSEEDWRGEGDEKKATLEELRSQQLTGEQLLECAAYKVGNCYAIGALTVNMDTQCGLRRQQLRGEQLLECAAYKVRN
ncbi:unnamed protein product [Closterium sp. NIES-65]|nr:unnamed protein product [Closterium sp. NIES-65]